MDHTLSPWMAHHTGWLAATIYAVTCLVVAGLLYLLVERPFLLLRDRHIGKVASSNPGIEARLDPAL